ncbi:murein transglycosylase domain-containing protein [Desulfoluna spongiiphila]|uniref:murein transglycosylase domain-containing protein n=1 Tax=Desulfoluna spongiiphila TaxID=419481 RepID=UPI00125460A2|nr:murein transglycosylase domain-containing protein [Desulfoluna spongiiphila]VVS95161.1 prokaryotic transglycosylase active site [Desulfoluna spongiiphila]
MGDFKLNAWHAGALKGVAMVLCLAGFLAWAQPVRADEFSDMQNEFNSFKNDEAEFESYKARVAREYAAYKTIIDEEFARYRGEILKVWGKPEVTTKKTYVGYSSDYKVKKVVDYEKGVIRISAVVPASEKEPVKVLEGHLKDLMNQSAKGAYKADQFTTGVEKKLKKKVTPSHLQGAEVGNKPIVADMVTGKLRPTTKEIDASVAGMMGSATMGKKKAPRQANAEMVTLEVKIPTTGRAVKARAYLPDVIRQAAKRGVDPALVFAVMETESAFNPMARSYVPAYGLMQIVPKSAGRDASKVVLGKDVVLSPSYLYNSGNNIAMGVAYLYILNDRYLASVKNPESRLYCVIAAYNTGAGNVARAFIGTTNINKAAKKINSMPPEKVYKVLIRKLPHKETRDYLQRVSKRIPSYQAV